MYPYNLKAQMLRVERRNIRTHFIIHRFFDNYIFNSNRHLDFGSGFGFIPYMISCRYPKMKVDAIDIDSKKISLGKSRYSSPNFRLMASGKIDGKYDTISCFNALHHLDNPKKQLDAFNSHLKMGGRFISIEPRIVSKENFMRSYFQPRSKELTKESIKTYSMRSFEKEYSHHCRWNMRDFLDMVNASGFKTVRVKKYKLNLLFVGERE